VTSPRVEALMLRAGLTHACNHCGRAVSEGRKYCDPYCAHESAAKRRGQ
jgi:hypothetical protein